MKPKVPGSLKTGPRRTGTSSPAFCSSSEIAPTKVVERVATKKKRSIFGGPPSSRSGPVSEDQR